MAKGQLEFDAVVSTDQLNKLLGDLRSGADGAAKAINDALGGTVTKKLVLETVTDESGSRQLVAVEKERLSVADKIVSAYRQADKVQAGSLTSLRQQVNEAKQARDAIAKYSEAFGPIGTKIRQINGEWATANQRLATISRQLDIAGASTFWDRVKVGLRAEGLISFSNGLVQITQGLQAASILVGGFIAQINNLVNSVAKLQSFQLGFVAAGAGAVGGVQALQEASRIALGLGSNLAVARDGFQKLTPVVLNSGGSLGNVSQITEALSSRFAAFGLSADASRRVMNGVIQAFAKGKLQAEELTQQISEADPAFKTDFANALGVTVQQLEALVKAGAITTDVLIKTLPALSKSELLYGKLGISAVGAVASLEKSNQAIGGVGVTTEQVRNQLDSLSQLNFERFATAFQPVINAFLKAQAVIIDFISYITKLEGIRGLGNIVAALSTSIINLIDALAKIAGVVATAISPILQLTGAIANSVPGISIITALIAVKLLGAFRGLPAAISAGLGAFGALGTTISTATSQYTGLGVAATGAAAKVTAAQAAITAASNQAPGAKGAKQLSLFGNAGDLAGTIGQVQQLELNLGSLNQQTNRLFPSFSKAFDAIKSGATGVGPSLSNLSSIGTSALGTLRTGVTGIGAAISTSLGSAAKSAVSALSTSLTGLSAVIAPLSAALIILGAAQQGVNGIMSGAKEISDSLKQSIADLNTELSKQGEQAEKSGNAWDASVQNVGSASASYDRLAQGINRILGPLRLATYEEARYNQATIAAARASQNFGQGLDRLILKYDSLTKNSDGSVQSQQKIKQAFEGLTRVISGRISSLDQQIKKEQALASSSNEVDASKKLLIATLQSEKATLEAVARSRGLETQTQLDQAAAAKQLASEIKAINDVEIERLRENKTQIQEKYKLEQDQINLLKESERTRNEVNKESLKQLSEQTKEYYSAQKLAIQEIRDLESQRASDEIRRLRGLTESERQLQELRIQELEKRASGGGLQALEAKAQLERIKAEQEIARIQEEERKKELTAKQKQAELEKAEKEKIKAIAATEREEEKRHKERMRELELRGRASTEEERQKVLNIDQQIAKLQKEISSSTRLATQAAGEFTGEMKNAETAANAVKKRMEEIRSIAATIRIPNIGAGRFAGGPVTAGATYTVNELGREMFLSSTGRLSEIKTKPWGSWTAPSSGTIIPAHIAAGIQIPNGNVKLSKSSSNLVDRSLGNRSSGNSQNFNKLIQAIYRGMSSNNNNELAAIQAHQAKQIGKLGRAVDDLASKDWNVNVKVKNVGNAAYLEALNHRM